jgi:hypothetical protein
MSLVKASRQSGVSEALLASRQPMARPSPTSTPGQWALKSSRQKRAMMSFLRGGMNPRAGGVAAALVAAEAAVSAPRVMVGFVFAVAAPVDPAPCDATVADVVADFFAAALADEEPVPAEEPCVDFMLADGAFSVPVGAAFAVLSDAAAAEDDAEPAGVDFSASAGDDAVAGAAAVAAGFASAAGFDAVCAVPELAGGVAVAITAFTAC